MFRTVAKLTLQPSLPTGQNECDDAIDQLNRTINQIDQAVLSAMSQQLQPHVSSSLQVQTMYLNWVWPS